jgi:hypothetical protein
MQLASDSAAVEAAVAALPNLLTGALLPSFSSSTSSSPSGVLPGSGGGAAAAVRRRTFRTRFLPEHVHEFYAQQAATTLSCLPPGHVRARELPSEFVSILPLDRAVLAEVLGGAPSSSAHATGTYGYVSAVYKAVSSEDGYAYAARRVDGARSTQAVMDSVVTAWARASHPSVATLRRAFPSTRGAGGGGGGPALFFCHDYFPGAKTLRELHLDTRAGGPIPESTLWSYTCQLVGGLRAVHEAGLAFRGIRAEHIVVTGRNRLRFTGAGVTDVLEADHPKPLEAARQADMQGLGQVLLQLAVRNPGAATPAAAPAALEAVRHAYSPAFHALVLVLIAKPLPATEVCRLLAPQLLAELDAAYDHADGLEHLLAREADNGRLLRLLLKLGFINERPEHEGDPGWAETGDRYLLKLFRDFVFHQATEDGRPVLDVAHVVDALNNLDAGTQTKVLLSSRDGASILVSSYAALRTAVNGSFDELRAAAARPDPSGDGAGYEASSASSSAATAAAAGGLYSSSSGDAAASDADWLQRPRVPAVVRARTGGAGMRGRARGLLGSRGAMGHGGGGAAAAAAAALLPPFGLMGGMGGLGGMAGFAEAMLSGGMGGGGGVGDGYGGGGGGGEYQDGVGGGGEYQGGEGDYQGGDGGGEYQGGEYQGGGGEYSQGGEYQGGGGAEGGGDGSAGYASYTEYVPGGGGEEGAVQYGDGGAGGDGGGGAGDAYYAAASAAEFVPGGVAGADGDPNGAGAAAFNVDAQEFRPTWS